jgi:large conductance mechanosensitive channel
MKNILNEFKDFALRGNIIDLAIGIIVGAGFNTVINSLVKNIILPPIGLILNKVDFSSLYISLSGKQYPSFAEAQRAGEATLNYGLFINDLISFLITAFCVFFIVRWINKIHKRMEQGKDKSTTTKPCPHCLSIIPVKATRCPHCTSTLA